MSESTDDETCAAALGEFTDLLIAGAAPSVDLFVLRYPDCERRLRLLLETTMMLFDAFQEARRG